MKIKRSEVVPGAVFRVRAGEELNLDMYKMLSGVARATVGQLTVTVLSKPRKIDGINLVRVRVPEAEDTEAEVFYCDLVYRCEHIS